MYSQFEVSVLTDKTEYLVGENIEITVTTYDLSSNPIILNWPDACQYDVVINGQPNIGCIFVPTQLTIKSLINHSWSFTYIETLNIGNHKIIGFVVNYGEPDTTSIHVRDTDSYFPLAVGTFENCFQFSVSNAYGDSYLFWFAEDVGLVKRSDFHEGSPSIDWILQETNLSIENKNVILPSKLLIPNS